MKASISIAICVIGTLWAGSLFAQEEEWRRLTESGKVQEQAGRYAEAAASYRKAIPFAEQFGPQDERLVLTLNALAEMYANLGQIAEAEHEYRRGLTLIEKVNGSKSLAYGVFLGSLASLYVETGRLVEGETKLRDSIAIIAAVLPRDDVHLAIVKTCLAEELLLQNRKKKEYQEAEQLLNEAEAVFEKSSPQKQDRLGIVLNNLGVVRRLQQRTDEAISLFQRSQKMLEAEFGPDHPNLVRVLNNLAAAYSDAGRRDDADAAFRRALEISEKRLGAEHPTYGAVLQNYAAFLQEAGHKKEAKTLSARCKKILEAAARRNGAGMTVDVASFQVK